MKFTNPVGVRLGAVTRAVKLTKESYRLWWVLARSVVTVVMAGAEGVVTALADAGMARPVSAAQVSPARI